MVINLCFAVNTCGLKSVKAKWHLLLQYIGDYINNNNNVTCLHLFHFSILWLSFALQSVADWLTGWLVWLLCYFMHVFQYHLMFHNVPSVYVGDVVCRFSWLACHQFVDSSSGHRLHLMSYKIMAFIALWTTLQRSRTYLTMHTNLLDLTATSMS